MSRTTHDRSGDGEKVFALVDCENFYVSCERVFDPALRARPVAVLSNNDGCELSKRRLGSCF